MEFLKVSASPMSPDIRRKPVIWEEENNKQEKKEKRNLEETEVEEKLKEKDL